MTPSFGETLKGARHGFSWSKQLGLFVRLDAVQPPFRFDLVPMGQIPKKSPGSGKHKVWWESADHVELITVSLMAVIVGRAFEGPALIQSPLTIHLDDEGQEVTTQ